MSSGSEALLPGTSTAGVADAMIKAPCLSEIEDTDFSVVLLRSDFVLVSLRVQAFLILVVISLNSLITLGIILARFQQFTQAYHR
jgi:hypothetical protein